MGVVYVQDKPFLISGTTPSPTEMARIQQRLAPKPEEEGLGSLFMKGVGRGIDAGQAGLYSMGEMIANQNDGSFLGRTKEEYRALADEQRAERDSVQGVQGGFLDQDTNRGRMGVLAQTLGETIPATLFGMGATAAGAIGGAAIGGPGGAIVGGGLGALAAAAGYAPQQFNENVEAQIAEHGDVKDWGKVTTATVLQAGAESIADKLTMGAAGLIGKTVSKSVIEGASKGAMRTIAGKIGSGAAIGAVTEVPTEVIQSALTRWQAEQGLMDEDAQRDYLESAIVAGILGGTIGGVAGVGGGISQVRNDMADTKIREIGAKQAKQDADIESQRLTEMAERSVSRETPEQNLPFVEQIKVEDSTASPDNLSDKGSKTSESNQVFSEDEYRQAVDALRNEKSVSKDKIRRNLKFKPQKASAIFDEIKRRGDAVPVGHEGQYLKIKSAVGNQTKEGSDYTAAKPVYREYGVEQTKDGFTVTETTTENGVQSSRIVQTHPTAKEANEAKRQLDPNYSVATNKTPVTPTIADEMGEYSVNLQKMADTIVGEGRVAVDVAPTINADYLAPKGIAAPPPNSVVEGVTIPPAERGLRQFIAVANDLYDPALPKAERQAKLNSVLGHELFHAVRNADLLTPKEWGTLVDYAGTNKVPGKLYTWAQKQQARRNAKSTPEIEQEEMLAEMFRAYMDDPTQFTGAPKNLLQKLADFLKRILKLARTRSADEILDAMKSGEIGKRETGSGGMGERTYPGKAFFSSVKVPAYYMKSDKFFMDAKQDKAPASQWLGMLKNAGIKQEELDWLGLVGWLKDQDGPVNRGDILDYIRANSVDIQERWAFENPPDSVYEELEKATATQDKRLNELQYELEHKFQIETDIGENFYVWVNEEADKGNPIAEEFVALQQKNDDLRRDFFPTQYHDFTTQSGGKDYVEVIFHIPTLKPAFSVDIHYGGFKNIIASARLKTRDYGNGKRTLFIEEIQSDLHQKGQKHGYNKPFIDPASLRESIVPDAPLKTTWEEFTFRRLLRYAAENGFDEIAWHGDPKSVADTEKWENRDVSLRTRVDAEGNPIYEIGPRDEADAFIETQSVTGVINTYLRKLRNIATKVGKPFQSVPMIVKGSAIDPLAYPWDELFLQPMDMRMAISDLLKDGSLPNDVRTSLKKMSQIARNQRTFDPVLAIEQSGIDPTEFMSLMEDTFPETGSQNSTYDEQGNPRHDRFVLEINDRMREEIPQTSIPLWSAVERAQASPEFRNWFGNSAVVDESGKPMVVYHATDVESDFDIFRPMSHFGTEEAAGDRLNAKLPLTSSGTMIGERLGIPYNQVTKWWAGLEPEERDRLHEEQFEINREAWKDARIYPVFLSIKNPLRIIDNGYDHTTEEYAVAARDAGAISEQYLDSFIARKAPLANLVSVLKAKGYDGFVYTNNAEDTGSDSWVAFDESQIKSVFNRGTWNVRDPRIQYSTVQYSASAPMGQRVPNTAPKDTLSKVELGMRYNNVAPILQKLAGVLPTSIRVPMTDTYITPRKSTQELIDGTFIALQDRMLPVGKLIDRIRDNGGFISNESDTYLREQLFSGQVDERLQANQRTFYNPLVTVVNNLPVSKEDMDDAAKINDAARSITTQYSNKPKIALAELYLYAQHAQERNAEMRRRNEDLQHERPEEYDAGSGMSDIEAQEILAWFDAHKHGRKFWDLTDANSVRSQFRRLISNTNDIRVAGGLNPDFRVMTTEDGEPIDPYEDYAPLRGFINEHVEDEDADIRNIAKTGKGYRVAGKEDLSAVGRSSLGADLIANAILQNEEAIIRAGKNEVANSFVRLIEDNRDAMKDTAEILYSRPMKYTYDRRAGKVRRVVDQRATLGPDILVAKQDGNEILVRIKDARVAKAMNQRSSLGNAGAGAIMKGLLAFNRFLAATRTSYNPEFMISNFLRDLEAAMVNISEHDMKEMKGQIIRSLPNSFKGIWEGVRHGTADTEWGKIYRDFREHGGAVAFQGIRDLANTIQRINSEFAQDLSGPPGKALKAIKEVGNLVEGMNATVENGIRVATYKALRDRFIQEGADTRRASERAAFMAKNLTVNFNMGGDAKPFMNAMYLFFNASIQGSMALINPLARSKKMRKIWASVLAMGLAQDIINSFLSDEDDDGIKQYDKIPDYILTSNIVFMDPFGISERGYFKIPMPYLMNGVYNTGRVINAGLRGRYTPGEAANSIVGVMADGLNPWGASNTWANFVAPTVLDPIVDLGMNANYQGAPIAPPETPFGVSERASQRYWNNTNPIYTSIAGWLANLPGIGGEGQYIPGAIEWSPNQIEYVMEWLGGGAWTFAARTGGLLLSDKERQGTLLEMMEGGDWSANDIPLLRRFYGNVSQREDLQYYLKNRDEVLRVRAELRAAAKDGDSEGYRALMERHPRAYRIASQINALENLRRKLSKQINKIRENKNIPDERKKALIKQLKERQADIVGRANARFRVEL